MYFSARTNQHETISNILNGEQEIELNTLSWHKDDVSEDDIVFIVISGDEGKKKFKYTNGLRAIGKVISKPIDSRDNKHFSLTVKIELLLSKTLEKNDFYKYPGVKDAPNIGPTTVNPPNQAFRIIPEKQGNDILCAVSELLPRDFVRSGLSRYITNNQIIKLKEEKSNHFVTDIKYTGKIIENFSEYINANGLINTDGINNVITSLITKPFLILTGNSGTGKTKMAELFAKWLNKIYLSKLNILEKTLNSKSILLKYEIISNSTNSIECINTQGSGGAIIPLAKNAIIEWFDNINNGDIPIDCNSTALKGTIAPMMKEKSSYQKYVHGFFSNYYDFALAMYNNSQDLDLNENTIIKQSSYELISVGADWTDNRKLLGFVNHLKKDENDKPTFQSTPILDLIMRAKDDSDYPYFLILDEMNLSHVERYFSDFLSAMELEDGKLHLHSEEGELKTSSGNTVGQDIILPKNLFVIGTVNIDETTYMFSPKVLDRANVIESKVSFEDLEKLFEPNGSKIGNIESAVPGTAEAFLRLARQAKEGELDAWKGHNKLQAELEKFFNVLNESGFEFAYRTVAEIIRYFQVANKLSGDQYDFNSTMDAQIIQKLLPKLHGSLRHIEPTIVALAKLCCKEEIEDMKTFVESRKSRDFKTSSERNPIYPDSYEKLCRMIDALRRDQFVSFIQ